MAIFFTGIASTQKILGSGLGNFNCFVIENRRGSSRCVIVRRIAVTVDAGEVALTAVKPWVRSYRGTFDTSLQEGITLVDKGYFDSTQTSDPYVKLWAAQTPEALLGGNTAPIVATTSSANQLWSLFSSSRNHTLAGAQLGDFTNGLPILLTDAAYDFHIYPGEALIVTLEAAAITSNPNTNMWLVNAVWTEETLATYEVSGNVKLSGSPVSGANVAVIVADDKLMSNPFLKGVVQSNAAGGWSSTIQNGKYAYAYARVYAANVHYTANANPFVSNI